MIKAIGDARADNVGLVVFPYASVAFPDDNARDDFVSDCNDAALSVIAATEGISVLFSSPVLDDDGINSYWSVFAEDGRLSAFGDADESTTLVSAYCGKFTIVPSAEIADATAVDTEKGSKFLVVQGREPFHRDEIESLESALSSTAKKKRLPLFYANSVGIENTGKCVSVYRGDSAVFDARGRKVAAAASFVEAEITLAAADCGRACVLPELPPFGNGVADIAEVLRFAIRDFMAQLGIKRVVIGVSGGIDSAVSAALYGSVMPAEDILLVSMPGPFTSGTTRRLGQQLARNLGARFAELPIGESVDLTKRQFAELITEGPHGAMAGAWSLSSFMVENVQARDRGSRVLAAAASAFGGVISCNANKDECTVGYGTLYGDIAGWLCALGDLWKGDVYGVGRYLNDSVFKREIIPEGIFTIKPSAELSEKQAVEKGLGDPLVYPYHDRLFQVWVEENASPYECLDWYANGVLGEMLGYEGDIGALFKTPADFIADLERWWNLYQGLAVAKRMQAPPLISVCSRSFGSFAESQNGPYYSPRYKELKTRVVSNES